MPVVDRWVEGLKIELSPIDRIRVRVTGKCWMRQMLRRLANSSLLQWTVTGVHGFLGNRALSHVAAALVCDSGSATTLPLPMGGPPAPDRLKIVRTATSSHVQVTDDEPKSQRIKISFYIYTHTNTKFKNIVFNFLYCFFLPVINQILLWFTQDFRLTAKLLG